jgi:hypothetical protein
MSRNLVLSIGLLGLLTPGFVQAASVEQARSYIQNRDLAAAKQELELVVASDVGDQEMAAALDLLAAIAVEEFDYVRAADLWERLLTDYPERAEELGAATKLKLAQALIGQEERKMVPTPAEEVPPGPVAAVPEPVEPSTEAEPEKSAPLPPPAPTSPPEPVRAGELPPPRVPGLVLVAGTGKPYDAAQHAVAELATYLIESGVNTELPTGGIPVVETSGVALARLLDAVEDRGAESLAFMRANFATVEKIVVEVYSPDGALLWKERVSGGTGHTGRPYSKTGVNKNLMERFLSKLAKRVGGPGLPVSR